MTDLVKADARQRAWRTVAQGLLVDLGVIVVPLILDAFLAWDGAGGKAYWTAVSLTLGKTAVTAVLAYIMRLRKAPAPLVG